MNSPVKQHLIDPELCIRCYTCESMCTVQAIQHDGVNVVVDFDKCNGCMDCIAPCPTGSIDNWRIVDKPYSLEEQFGWTDLPEQQDFAANAEADASIEAFDPDIARLLAEAHGGAGGRAKAPRSATKPTINLYTLAKPAEATVQGNYRLTADGADSDVRHVILDFGAQPFPVLEGQSLGVIPPGVDAGGKAHLPRLYSVSSPRDGERPNFNNLSLTVKREPGGVASNYVCDLKKGDKVRVVGPFGATFLMPNDPRARLLMICTGTGSAPFRAFTMRRQRSGADEAAGMTLVFGARTPDSAALFRSAEKSAGDVAEEASGLQPRSPVSPSAMSRTSCARSRTPSAISWPIPTPTSMSAGFAAWSRASKRRWGTSPRRWACNGARCATRCARKAATTARPIDGRGLRRESRPSFISFASDGAIAIPRGSHSPGGWRPSRWKRSTPGGSTSSAPTGIG